jgi:hypothetical protein
MRKALLLACCLLGGCANLDEEARSDDANAAFTGRCGIVTITGTVARNWLPRASNRSRGKSGAKLGQIAIKNG